MSICNNYENKTSNEYNNDLGTLKNTDYEKLHQLNSCIQKSILHKISNMDLDNPIEKTIDKPIEKNKENTIKKLNEKTLNIFNYNISYILFKLSIFIVLFYYYRIL